MIGSVAAIRATRSNSQVSWRIFAKKDVLGQLRKTCVWQVRTAPRPEYRSRLFRGL